MPYCSSTGKFAGLNDPEAEIDSEDVSGSTASFEVRVIRACSDCGDETGTYDSSVETDIEHECPPLEPDQACQACKGEGVVYQKHDDGPSEKLACDCTLRDDDEPEFEISVSDVSVDEYMQTHTRAGKPIPAGASSRYRKRLFEVTVTATVVCSICNEEIEIEASERDIAASSFDAVAH